MTTHPPRARNSRTTTPHQAAKLLAMFRELKRRQALRLGPFYARRLAALEDALLAARAALFEAQEEGHPPGGGAGGRGAAAAQGESGAAGGAGRDQGGRPALRQEDAPELARRCWQLERDVAEARQLREEEAALLARTVEAMRRVWGELLAARARQGCALTGVQMQLVEAQEEDDTPLQPVRERACLRWRPSRCDCVGLCCWEPRWHPVRRPAASSTICGPLGD